MFVKKVGILRVALAVLCLQFDQPRDAEVESAAAGESRLKDAAAIDRSNASGIEGAHDRADAAQGKFEDAVLFGELDVFEFVCGKVCSGSHERTETPAARSQIAFQLIAGHAHPDAVHLRSGIVTREQIGL